MVSIMRELIGGFVTKNKRAIVYTTLTSLVVLAAWYFLAPEERHDILISDRMSDFIDSVDHSHIPKKNQIIIFDLDDTVFMSLILLGTPTWFYNMVNLVRRSGVAQSEAISLIEKIDRVVQEHGKVVAVEHATLEAINRWQRDGAVVVGLSSRPPSYRAITEKQLAQINLAFKSPIFDCIEKGWDFTVGAFKQGVIYLTEPFTKSQIFEQFHALAGQCGMDVELVAQADDQQRYVAQIANFAKGAGLDFIGLIYGGALAKREFDVNEANYQLQDLENSLSINIVPEIYRPIFATGH